MNHQIEKDMPRLKNAFQLRPTEVITPDIIEKQVAYWTNLEQRMEKESAQWYEISCPNQNTDFFLVVKTRIFGRMVRENPLTIRTAFDRPLVKVHQFLHGSFICLGPCATGIKYKIFITDKTMAKITFSPHITIINKGFSMDTTRMRNSEKPRQKRIKLADLPFDTTTKAQIQQLFQKH